MAKINLNQDKNKIKLTKEKREKLGIPEGAYLKAVISEDEETKYQVCLETEVEEEDFDPDTKKFIKVKEKKQIVLKTLSASELE